MKNLQKNIILSVVVGIPHAVFAQWTDITPNEIKNTSGQTMGVTFGDVDFDGDDDLIIATGASVGGKTMLFLNDGSGNFTNATQGIFAEHHNVWSPLLGDSDNDGDLDLFFVAFGEQCRLYENQGDLQFVELSSNGIFTAADNMMARGGSWVDYDSDGLLDIMVSTNAAKVSVGRDKLYKNMGNNTFEDVSPDIFAHQDIGRGIAWCDFDNDGDLDLYAAGGKGCPCPWEQLPSTWLGFAENRMFRNDGGFFTDVTDTVTVDIQHARGVATGDYDNDGDMDLYICNVGLTGEEGDNPESYLGPNRLLRNDGDFQFTDVTPTSMLCVGGERSCAWFDMDNDGDLDMIMTVMWNELPTVGLFENINNGASFVWHDELKVFVNPIYEGNSGTGGGIADIDNDGDLDLMLAYKFGPNQLLRNDLDNGNNWIKISLVGTTSNRSAIGARIVVTADGVSRIREVQSGSGYWTQHSLVQHVGLGQSTNIDEVQVIWPSGIVQVIQSPLTNYTMQIVESEGCSTDLNNDGIIDIDDLLVVIMQWGQCKQCTADFNGDFEVDIDDILILIGNWGFCAQ